MFARMFKIIDAELIRSSETQDLIKKGLIAKVIEVIFYKMSLWVQWKRELKCYFEIKYEKQFDS